MRTKTKKTKQITQIVVSMLLVLTMVFMPMKMILAADAQSSSTPTQFVLVLDCSGSMEESDVNGLSPKAAKMFVDMMPVENAQIAVVAFGANWGEDSYVYPGDTTSNTYTKVILGMTDVGTEKAKKKVKEAIDETAKVRDKNGYTTIGYALQAAEESEILLKNENNVLPLVPGKKILLTGPNANSMRCLNGGWSYSWQGDQADNCAGAYNTIYESVQQVWKGKYHL